MLTEKLRLQSLLVGVLWLAGLSDEDCYCLGVVSFSGFRVSHKLSVSAVSLWEQPCFYSPLSLLEVWLCSRQKEKQSPVNRDREAPACTERVCVCGGIEHCTFLVVSFCLTAPGANSITFQKCCLPSLAPKWAVPLLNCVGFHNNTVLVSFPPRL